MTGHIRSLRPARAAIAAVLAFSSPTLLAQDVVPPGQPAIANASPEPAPPAASAPTFAPAQPVVQATPSVAERLEAAIAAAPAEGKTQTPGAQPGADRKRRRGAGRE